MQGKVLVVVVALAAVLSLAVVGEPSVLGNENAKKPLIGINVDLNDNGHKEASISALYYEAIERSGGLPVLIPPMPAGDIHPVLSKLDGVLLIGGADYPPALYGEEAEKFTSVMHKERSDFDLALVKEALKMPAMPILGICAGCQVLNISDGGTLIQDIPAHNPQSKVLHASPEGWQKGFHKHLVEFEKGTRLAAIYQAPLTVPTSHHQCIGKVGSDFKIVAHAQDGLPEAIERAGDRFVVGVQFHPERDFEHNKALFSEFIQEACKRQTNKMAQGVDQ